MPFQLSKCDPKASSKVLREREFDYPEAMEMARRDITRALELPYDSSWQAIIQFWERKFEEKLIKDENLQNSSVTDNSAQCKSKIEMEANPGTLPTILSDEREATLRIRHYSVMAEPGSDWEDLQKVRAALVRNVDDQLGINRAQHE